MEQLNQIINALMPYVITIVTAIAGYVALKIKTKLDEKVNAETEKISTETKREVVEATVLWVQQVYEALDGKEKLQKALSASIEWLNEKGITITEAEATMLIEASIKGFKDSWNTPMLEAPAEETVEEVIEVEASK